MHYNRDVREIYAERYTHCSCVARRQARPSLPHRSRRVAGTWSVCLYARALRCRCREVASNAYLPSLDARVSVRDCPELAGSKLISINDSPEVPEITYMPRSEQLMTARWASPRSSALRALIRCHVRLSLPTSPNRFVRISRPQYKASNTLRVSRPPHRLMPVHQRIPCHPAIPCMSSAVLDCRHSRASIPSAQSW
jgi:hypothetical protein